MACFCIDHEQHKPYFLESAKTRQDAIYEISNTISQTSYTGAALDEKSLHYLLMSTYSKEALASDINLHNFYCRQLWCQGEQVCLPFLPRFPSLLSLFAPRTLPLHSSFP
jgi:hypothetical protein